MTDLQIAFIVITPIIVLIIVGLICYKPIMKAYTRKNFKNTYYKKIYKTTLYGDYFLINDFMFFHQDNKTTTVDHLMLGEKFIYVIKDYYFKGDLKGSGDDKSLIFVPNDENKSKCYIDNPLLESRLTVKRLEMVTNIDRSLIIGICLVNEECKIDVNYTDDQFYIIGIQNFQKLVKAIEARDIPAINQDELQQVVKDLDRLNRKGKKHVKTNI